MIGESVAMRALRKQIAVVAPTDGRVLIYGESGTGKELVARTLHLQSRRAGAPFVEVNSAAIPEELIESELFGHVKGAFTGAMAAKKGKFELADGATLFLDEVADMSARVQAKVLRVLEEQRFESVGSNASVRVDVRVIAATNKRLDTEIEQGNFRADLFYRLNVIPFEIPPLRERLEDVPALVEYFNQRFSSAYGKKPKSIEAEALEALQNYSWPGNIRELKNTIERVVIMQAKNKVTAGDLPVLGGEEPPAASFSFPLIQRSDGRVSPRVYTEKAGRSRRQRLARRRTDGRRPQPSLSPYEKPRNTGTRRALARVRACRVGHKMTFVGHKVKFVGHKMKFCWA